MMKDFTLDGAPYNTRQIQIIVVTSLLVFLSTLAFALRLWARKIQGVGFYKDDWVIGVGLVSFVTLLDIHHYFSCSAAVVKKYLLTVAIVSTFANNIL